MVGDGNEGNGGRGGKLHLPLSLCLQHRAKPKRSDGQRHRAERPRSRSLDGVDPGGSRGGGGTARQRRAAGGGVADAGTARRSLPRAPVRRGPAGGRLHHAAGPAGRSAAGAGPRAPGPAPCRAARFLSAALLPACTLGVAALGLARYRLIVHPLRPGARPPPTIVLTAVWAAAGLLGALSLLGPPPAPAPGPGSLLGPGGRPRALPAALGAAGLRATRPPAARRLRQHLPSWRRRAALRPPRPARGSRPRSDSLDSRLSILPPLRPRPPWGKAALAPALAVGQFAACWLPYGCACLAPAAQAAAAEAAVTWIAYSAFAAHPFLYGLLQRPVRRTLGRLARRALPWSPRACTSRAWHPRALLQHLQRPPEGPALGPSEAPDQGRDLTERESLSMSEAT
uniref:Uncharacterized protein n=1 Tax=Bos indicus x Bos taurus TaxID=30522 RepID=A0A4W2C196_BOBOX